MSCTRISNCSPASGGILQPTTATVLISSKEGVSFISKVTTPTNHSSTNFSSICTAIRKLSNGIVKTFLAICSPKISCTLN
uniref:Uncharacterized protein n=1 Tax=Cucumis melo TaxID=3656 RepID=A0A9I9E4K1_CUCME